jgi:hypothetical protein
MRTPPTRLLRSTDITIPVISLAYLSVERTIQLQNNSTRSTDITIIANKANTFDYSKPDHQSWNIVVVINVVASDESRFTLVKVVLSC